MFKISCFADEISAELDEQIAFMKYHDIKYLSLRNVGEKNVLELSDSALDSIAEKLLKNGICVSSIGSPIGKTSIKDPADNVYAQTRIAVNAARRLNCNKIRVFSFYMDKNELDLYRDEVILRSKKMVEICENSQIQLISENEAGIYGETSQRLEDLITAVGNSYYRAVLDPSNYVAAGENPYSQSFARINKYIEYVHIKDSRRDGTITPAGEGDGHIFEILNDLKERDLFLTLEPHLSYAGKMYGFSGAKMFEKAYNALISILNEAHCVYR